MSSQILAHQITADLGARIVQGVFPPGHVLRITDLEAEFDVSRTAVREAIKQLESLRLVTSRRRVGIEVTQSAEWSLLSPDVLEWQLDGPHHVETLKMIGEVRRGVEPTAAALAAVRATRNERKKLLGLIIDMEATAHSGDLVAFLRHDIDFHHTILTASRNPMLASLAYIIEHALSGRTRQGLMPEHPRSEPLGWHRDLAIAIADGDAERAEETAMAIVEEAVTGVEDEAKRPRAS